VVCVVFGLVFDMLQDFGECKRAGGAWCVQVVRVGGGEV